MIEAIPRKVKAPESEEFIRVGIVLAEDKKQELSIKTTPGATFEMGKEERNAAQSSFTIRVESGKLLAIDSSGKEILRGAKLEVKSADIHDIQAGNGIWIDSVVAGRSFHWRKEIKQCFSGDLEFIASEDHLLLVNIVPFEDYLACVVSSEMSSECPPDFAKAQLTAARCWAKVFLGDKHPGEPFDICNDDDCQRYQGTTHLRQDFYEKVKECRGEFLITEDGYVCATYYSKSCGGVIEDSNKIFSFPVEGLQALPDTDGHKEIIGDLREEDNLEKWLSLSSEEKNTIYCSDVSVKENTLKKYIGAVDEAGKYFRWEYELTSDVIIDNLNNKFSISDAAQIKNLVILERSVSGRATKFDIVYLTSDGSEKSYAINSQYDIRSALHPSFLFSTAFLMEIERNPEGNIQSVNFTGAGWGHGVGLCQIGALGMSLKGIDYRSILKHYYPDTIIKKVY